MKEKKNKIDYSKPLKDEKREKFCHQFLIDLNGKQAAIRANYSEKGAKQQGSRLLTYADVQGRITYLKSKRAERTQIKADDVVKELAKIGFANVQDYINTDNNIVDLSGIKRELAAAVESIQVDIRHDGGDSKGYTEKVRLKLHSKLNALTDLGKHLGIFGKDNEQGRDRVQICITPEAGNG